jgi:hypothetical protein
VSLHSKLTNPKDQIGSAKLDLSLVPDTMEVYAAMAFTEGALKYGAYNWRVAGVRASIYRAALGRHIKKWWNGEWEDPRTQVPHLANALACIAIILDAHVVGQLNDDRPPKADLAHLIDSAEKLVGHLKGMSASLDPHHCTHLQPEPKPESIAA